VIVPDYVEDIKVVFNIVSNMLYLIFSDLIIIFVDYMDGWIMNG
jgi:hypothetical protein